MKPTHIVIISLFLFGSSLVLAPFTSEKSDQPNLSVRQNWIERLAFGVAAQAQGEPVASHMLSDVLSKELVGVDLEDFSKDSKKKLEDQAQTYVKFRQGKLPNNEKALFFVNCLVDSQKNPFCEYLAEFGREPATSQSLQDLESPTAKKSSDESHPVRQASTKDLRQWVTEGRVSEFKDLSRQLAYRGVRSFSDWQSLEAVTKITDSLTDCKYAGLYSALAMKSEEFFPEEGYKEKSVQYYKKTADCSDELPEAAEFSRYRLGLILIWKNQCEDASKHFSKISEDRNGEYTTRALYWQVWCAAQEKDKATVAVLRKRMVEWNPLSFHSIAANDLSSPLLGRIASSATPIKILMRSKQYPGFNLAVRLIEILQRIKAPYYAREILTVLLDHEQKLEPELRVYLAVLAGRLGAHVMQFRYITGIFRDSPDTINRELLEMFFPKKQFQTIASFKKKMDPYLMLALIRQESAFNERARSPVGAMGLMQLMPGTARSIQRKISHLRLLRPETNVRLGVTYFNRVMDQFEDDVELSLAAYNAGARNVESWRRRYPTENRMLFLDLIPFLETRNYVSLIGRNYFWYIHLYEPSAAPSRAPASKRGNTQFKGLFSF